MCPDIKLHPLSAAQNEVWLAQQARPANPCFNIAQFTRINGPIDPAIFETALRQIIDEANALRLRLVNDAGGIRQRIDDNRQWKMPFIDVSTQVDPHAAAVAWMSAERQQNVDPLHNSLFCYALLKLSPAQFLWYHRYHHIIMDGYGRLLIMRRLAAVYSALLRRQPPEPCPFRPIERMFESDARYRSSVQRIEDERYWLERCAKLPKPVSFSEQRAPASANCITQTFHASRPVAGDGHRRRLAAIATAAMAAYLYRYTGAPELLLCLVVNARIGENRWIPGLICNGLILRLPVRANMSLSSLVELSAAQIDEGLEHQQYRIGDLHRALECTHGQRIFGPTINLMPDFTNLLFAGHTTSTVSFAPGSVSDIHMTVHDRSDGQPLQVDLNANPIVYRMGDLITHRKRLAACLHALTHTPSSTVAGIMR
ncbi:hypothetical protein IHE33_05605 [Mycetohabitans endofungorum]|uniref:condensation domain-containing protein n=1 Tax=Mycetohabitans endofungorum TaxID=417203 RepID=UPI0030CCCB33